MTERRFCGYCARTFSFEESDVTLLETGYTEWRCLKDNSVLAESHNVDDFEKIQELKAKLKELDREREGVQQLIIEAVEEYNDVWHRNLTQEDF